MIKYLGSKRRLVPALATLAAASGARTALDLFCGTTRVSQAFKSQGIEVTAVDSTRCAHVLARILGQRLARRGAAALAARPGERQVQQRSVAHAELGGR